MCTRVPLHLLMFQMAGIPESAICYHKDGVVQSYNIVATEDIPALSAEPFSPFILEQNAVTLLKFLQVGLFLPSSLSSACSSSSPYRPPRRSLFSLSFACLASPTFDCNSCVC